MPLGSLFKSKNKEKKAAAEEAKKINEALDKKKQSVPRWHKIFKALIAFLPIVTWGTAGAIVVLASISFIIPKYKAVTADANAQISDKEDEIYNKEKDLLELTTLKEDYDAITDVEFAKISQILPEGKDIPGLIVQLEALVRKNGLNITSIDISDVKDNVSRKDTAASATPAGLQELSINLVVTGGTYNKFKELIKSIEQNVRLFDIISLGFTPLPDDESGQAPSDSFGFNIKTYYISSPEETVRSRTTEAAVPSAVPASGEDEEL